MWAYTMFFVLLGVFFMLMPTQFIKGHPDNFQKNKAEAIAQNFIVYRNSVREYALNNPSYTGKITGNTLPSTWENLNIWTNTMNSDVVYIYGDTIPGVEDFVMKKLNHPINTGIKSGSTLISQSPSNGNNVTNDVSVPSSIPDDSLVSAIKVSN